MGSAIKAEAGDIAESIGDEADGATEVGGTADGPIDLIAGSIACMDVLTDHRVARLTTAGPDRRKVGCIGVAGAAGADGPIDPIAASIACMDVLTDRRVARRPTKAGRRPGLVLVNSGEFCHKCRDLSGFRLREMEMVSNACFAASEPDCEPAGACPKCRRAVNEGAQRIGSSEFRHSPQCSELSSAKPTFLTR
jgi:hypothetical protein